jgi:hypothetical protein
MTTVSWKDVIESQITELDNYGTPEDMYTDPAESTPDEWTNLLYEIDHDIRNANGLSEPGLIALREVVELHKPHRFENAPDLYKFVCQHCQLGVMGHNYPCPTIQVIQKRI